MVQFWVLIVVVLFAGVQLFQWLQGAILPLPLYVMAGAFLAIASNYDKGMGRLINRGEQAVVTLGDTLQAELNPQNAAVKQPELKSATALALPEFVQDMENNRQTPKN
ncbi:MAG: hypothetical protein VKL20_05820 [Synechocystis sp.]|nr:hypothetical protein [Synechocystis sp.]